VRVGIIDSNTNEIVKDSSLEYQAQKKLEIYDDSLASNSLSLLEMKSQLNTLKAKIEKKSC